MSHPSAPNGPRPRRWPLVLLLLAVVLILGAGGYLVWTHFHPWSDPVAAMAANNRGVGHMEQFQYDDAVTDFEEAVRLAPDWLPAQINLGIALLNAGGKRDAKKKFDLPRPDNSPLSDPALDRAVAIFQDVLSHDPDNLHAHYCIGVIEQHRNKLAEAYPHFDFVTRRDPEDAHAWLRKG